MVDRNMIEKCSHSMIPTGDAYTVKNVKWEMVETPVIAGFLTSYIWIKIHVRKNLL